MTQFDVFGIFNSPTVFVFFGIALGGLIGAYSRKLSIAAYGALLIYAHVVINTDLFIYNAIFWLVALLLAGRVAFFGITGYLEGNSGATEV